MQEEQQSIVFDETKSLRLIENIPELQHKIKKEPESYQEELRLCIRVFKMEFEQIKEKPLEKNQRFVELAIFLSQISDLYKQNLEFVVQYLQQFLDNYAEQSHGYLREKIVMCLILLRNKNLIAPLQNIITMTKLFRVKDKTLRKIVLAHITNDITRLLKIQRNVTANRQIMAFFFEILKNNSDNVAKRVLQIMVELYKKKVWVDKKTINMISEQCMNSNHKMKLMAGHFLIETTLPQVIEESSDEEDHLTTKEKKFVKKTKSRQARIDKDKKKAQKKLRKRMQGGLVAKNFFPIDQIINPQDFGEKLLSTIKKIQGHFDTKLMLLQVLGRIINRHQLVILGVYSYLQRYIHSNQKQLDKVMGVLVECTHSYLEKEELEGVVKHTIDQLVCEVNNHQVIVIGLNALREMVIRNTLILQPFQINYLVSHVSFKEKNVSQSARSILNLYRQIDHKVLDKKYQGYYTQKNTLYKQQQFDILDHRKNVVEYGAELLGEGSQVVWDRILDDDDFKKIRAIKKRKEQEKEDQFEEDIEEKYMSRLNRFDEEEEEEEEEGEEEEGEEEYDEEDDMEEEEEDDIEYEEEGEEMEEEEQEQDKIEEEKNKNKKKKKSLRPALNLKEGEVDNYSDGELTDQEDYNPHGFVDGLSLSKFKKTKTDQRKELKERMATMVKEKAYKGPKQKGGGTTNIQKLKKKPLMMVRPKKNKMQQNAIDSVKQKIKKIKNQLGHVRNAKEFKRKKEHKKKQKFN